jgi:hypothetical protein
MKNILLLLTVALSISSNAQGNLQFNQVVMIDTTASWYSGGSAVSINLDLYIVPVGKVLKITNFYGDATGAFKLKINSVPVAPQNSNGPIWLSSGDVVAITSGSGCNFCTNTIKGYFSAIEFNIIPDP